MAGPISGETVNLQVDTSGQAGATAPPPAAPEQKKSCACGKFNLLVSKRFREGRPHIDGMEAHGARTCFERRKGGRLLGERWNRDGGGDGS